MSIRATSLLACVIAACGGGSGPGGGPALWVGERGAPRVLAFARPDEPPTIAAQPPAIDGPVRALLVRRDGAVVALQEPLAGAPPAPVPPAVLLSRAGDRLAVFPGEDGGGVRLFDAANPPWAAAEDASGRLWVTGRTAPVVYDPSGALAQGQPDPLPSPSHGIAALPDGRVVVSCVGQALAVYAADGTVAKTLAPALGDAYGEIDALQAEPGGTLLLATRRVGPTSEAIVVRATLGDALVLSQDPAASVGLGDAIPSALAVAPDAILVAPSLGPLAPAACVRWLSSDLAVDGGCAVAGAHRGVAWLE